MKRVKYKVTGDFGSSPPGEIREAVLIWTEPSSCKSLLYHPRGKGTCASLELCVLDSEELDEDIYITDNQGNPHEPFLNIDRQKQLDQIVRALSEISYKNLTEKVFEQKEWVP